MIVVAFRGQDQESSFFLDKKSTYLPYVGLLGVYLVNGYEHTHPTMHRSPLWGVFLRMDVLTIWTFRYCSKYRIPA